MSSLPLEADVLIVGAGPAGATTSLFLERQGVEHCVIDQSSFPRDKICGDALSGKVLDVLARLDPALVEEMETMAQEFLPCYGITFVAPNGTELSIPFRTKIANRQTAAGFISPRLDFDAFMVSKIRPERLHTGCRMIAIRSANAQGPQGYHEVEVEQQGQRHTIRARYLLGCEGERSLVAK
ncbi:MAG: NAD(P)/FAD-dependent oxidoreductase, partial [Bacteroidota bacterium]